jgi:hypothetical protein
MQDASGNPVILRPGMTYTASDGTTTRTLLIERLTFDRLDPATQMAAGTAAGPNRLVQVYIHWDTSGQEQTVQANVYTDPCPDPVCDWFVDVANAGGQVQPDSRGDAFLQDDGADGNYDFTWTTIFVTSLSLKASAEGKVSSAIAGAAGAKVVQRGARVLLSGGLSARTVACVSRKRVQLLRLFGGRKKVLESSRTTRRGRYSFSRKVRRTTRFTVRYRGNRACQRSKSRVRTVHVAGA